MKTLYKTKWLLKIKSGLLFVGAMIFSVGAFAAFSAGTYTIDAGGTASGTVYKSFKDLATDLSNGTRSDGGSANGPGISGAITVNVKASSGPYTEQVLFKPVSGASATNTITINGNGETLQYTATSSSNSATIKIDGGDYYTIDNLTILAKGSSYARCIHMRNSADYNTVKNCDLQMTSMNSTSNYNSYIAITNGNASPFSYSDPGEYITITNNKMSSKTKGPYAGIMMVNESSGTVKHEYNITNNEIVNFYNSGIYGRYIMDANISNNEIHNTSNATNGVKYGIYQYNYRKGMGHRIINNKIHHLTFATSGSQYVYGVYLYAYYGTGKYDMIVEDNDITIDATYYSYGVYAYPYYATSTATVKVSDNKITSYYNGTYYYAYSYGIYVGAYRSSTDHVEIMGNEINQFGDGGGYGIYLYAYYHDNNVDNTVANNAIFTEKPYYYYGIYAYSPYMSEKTNVVYNTLYNTAHPTVASSGYFYGIMPYYIHGGQVKNNIISLGRDGNTAYAYYSYDLGTSPTWDNNIIDVSRVSGVTMYYGFNGGTAYNSFSTWQAGPGGANSMEMNPLLTKPSKGDFTPQAFSMVNKGTPIKGVTDDLNGTTRNKTTPDIGAIEFFLDVAITDLKMKGNNECGGYQEPVTITVKNTSAVDITGIPVAYDVNGVGKVSQTIDSSIGPGKSMDFTFNKIPEFNGTATHLVTAYLDASDDVPTNHTQTHTIKTIASPYGANLVQGSTFDAYFRLGASGGSYTNPDVIAPGVEVKYEMINPTMHSGATFNTNWTLTANHMYENGTPITTDVSNTNPTSSTNGVLTFKPGMAMTDSLVWVGFIAHDNSTGCDSSFGRWVYVPHIPTPDFIVKNVCDGEVVAFQDRSTLAQGLILYDWQFNDKGSLEDFSEISDPVYKFSTYGEYNVELTVFSFEYPLFKYTKAVKVTVFPVPTVKFKVASACEDVNLKFTNNTTSPITGTIDYTWDFGDGSKSNVESPTHLYAKAGGYAVTLTASLNGCAASLTKNASQFSRPVASFTATGKCMGEDVQMNNTSTIAIGQTGYAWDFGDGDVSNLKEPVHAFGSAGIKTIKLKAISEFGCEDSTTFNISLLEAPVADFSHTEACNLTDVDFTRLGSLPSGTSIYEWDFAGESVSTRENPSHKFSTIGVNEVSLKITSSNGCTDMISKTLNVKLQAIAGFEAGDVCEGDDVVFTNTSKVAQGELDYTWRFGDLGTSNYTSPTHKYSLDVAGETQAYSVTLVANVEGGCADSATKSVVVNAAPDAMFTATTDGRKVIISNQATTTSDVKYNWRFGDGTQSIDITPDFTYGVTSDFEVFEVCLSITNNAGCKSTHCQDVTVDLVGIEGIVNNDMIKVYPNPSTGLFNISIENPKSNLEINIVSLIGETVTSVEVNSMKSTYGVDMSNFANGVYFVQVSNGGFTAVKKITLSK
jgi:PKD repeat protein